MKIFGKILLLSALLTGFYSCESDDNGGVIPETKPESVLISYSYENSADFFRYVDVEVTYLDINGKEHTEILANNTWKYEESVKYAAAPKSYACKITLKKKGVTPESETFECQGFGSYSFNVSCVHDDGNTYPFGPTVRHSSNSKAINAEGFLGLIPDEGKLLYEYTYTPEK